MTNDIPSEMGMEIVSMCWLVFAQKRDGLETKAGKIHEA